MLNIHTHNALPDAIYNIRYGKQGDVQGWSLAIDNIVGRTYDGRIGRECFGGGAFSVGVHPWDSAAVAVDDAFVSLAEKACFIGECGLDKPCGIPIYIQQSIFEQQIVLAEKLHKPMIIHCVGMYGRLLDMRKKSSSPTWVVHGCYASKEWIREAAKYDMAFSLGMRELCRPRANEILTNIPISRLFLETDEADNIVEVYNLAAQLLGMTVTALDAQIVQNYQQLLCRDANDTPLQQL